MSDASDEQNQQREGGLFSRLFGRGRSSQTAAPEAAARETVPSALGEGRGTDAAAHESGAEEALAEDAQGQAALGVPAREIEPPAEAAEPLDLPTDTPKQSWWRRLRAGLARSSTSLTQGISDIFAKRKLDDESLDDLEDLLLRADLGIAAAGRIRDAVSSKRYEKGLGAREVREILASEVERLLSPVAAPLLLDQTKKPFVVLVVGVNGSGKTTTIGKLSAKFIADGHKVVLAAGDTFRAAAIEQLQIWGARVGAEVVARAQGAEPASLAFDALKQCRASGADVLIVDTAGRLQNRKELMAELEKIGAVMKKLDPEAPHAVLLVLDATIGQNALSQVEAFVRVAGVTGLVMTKLDGTARGGILVAVAERFGLPVHYIGVGEALEDLEPFEAADFARAIAGLDDAPA